MIKWQKQILPVRINMIKVNIYIIYILVKDAEINKSQMVMIWICYISPSHVDIILIVRFSVGCFWYTRMLMMLR